MQRADEFTALLNGLQEARAVFDGDAPSPYASDNEESEDAQLRARQAGAFEALRHLDDYLRQCGVPADDRRPLSALAGDLANAQNGSELALFKPRKKGGRPPAQLATTVAKAKAAAAVHVLVGYGDTGLDEACRRGAKALPGTTAAQLRKFRDNLDKRQPQYIRNEYWENVQLFTDYNRACIEAGEPDDAVAVAQEARRFADKLLAAIPKELP